MRAGGFVIRKLQFVSALSLRLEWGYIIDLLSDKIQPVRNLAQPRTFNELYNLIRKLEEEHKAKREKNVSSLNLKDNCPPKEN